MDLGIPSNRASSQFGIDQRGRDKTTSGDRSSRGTRGKRIREDVTRGGAGEVVPVLSSRASGKYDQRLANRRARILEAGLTPDNLGEQEPLLIASRRFTPSGELVAAQAIGEVEGRTARATAAYANYQYYKRTGQWPVGAGGSEARAGTVAGFVQQRRTRRSLARNRRKIAARTPNPASTPPIDAVSPEVSALRRMGQRMAAGPTDGALDVRVEMLKRLRRNKSWYRRTVRGARRLASNLQRSGKAGASAAATRSAASGQLGTKVGRLGRGAMGVGIGVGVLALGGLAMANLPRRDDR